MWTQIIHVSHPTNSLRNKLDLPLRHRLGNTNLVRLGRLKRPYNGRIPDIQHLDIAGIIRVHAVPKIRRAAEARVLIDDPDRALRLVQALCPGNDGAVQFLDLCVVVADADGNDLRDYDFGPWVRGAHGCDELSKGCDDVGYGFVYTKLSQV